MFNFEILDIFGMGFLLRSCSFGSIRGGVFDGQIETEDGTFYVERVEEFLTDEGDSAEGKWNHTKG